MKYLGGINNSKLFKVTSELKDTERPNLFVSKIVEVSNDTEERRLILEELGYDFFDFDLWKAWLFLEESSAEILIKDYFIKWFTPSLLNKIRTFSSGGTSSIISKFEDFNKLFVFLHLQPVYKNKVWVIIDGGKQEDKIIEKLKDLYKKSGWNESNFSQFSAHDFELFYPELFKEKVDTILKLTNKEAIRKSKKELLEEVKAWINNDETIAKVEFKKSAKEVIEKLKKIEIELNQ